MTSDDKPDDRDTSDEPLALLADLENETVSNFPARVRRGIERRFISRDLVSFYVVGVTYVVMEWLALGFEHFAERLPDTGKGER